MPGPLSLALDLSVATEGEDGGEDGDNRWRPTFASLSLSLSLSLGRRSHRSLHIFNDHERGRRE